jgi:hypothetical protein
MPNGTATVLVPSRMPVDLPPPIKDSTGRGRVYVNPPVIHLGSGNKQLREIHFTNNTGGTVRVWLLEAASLFARPPKEYKDFKNPFVIEKDKTLDLDLKPDLDCGDYHYHVYCDVIGHEAEGNSAPGMSCP